MKKLLITLVAAMAMAFSANAQFYVGGSLGLSVVAAMSSVANEASSSFFISPEVGYDFNDKIAAGASMTFAGSSFNFSLDPYFRWKFAKVKSTKFFTDCVASLGAGGGVFKWGVSVQPGISFAITDKVSFVTRVSALGFQGAGGTTIFRFNLFGGASVGAFYNF